jgi:16S rRNA (guanine(966)-N(2))-methyltransferase RsmD
MDVWSKRLPGARVLDLFAGSGAVGIEALSRGASELTLVESDPQAVRRLRRTCRELALASVRVVRATLPAALVDTAPGFEGPFDLVFADPPYAFDQFSELLEASRTALAEGGEIVVEHAVRQQVPDRCAGLRRADQRRYGDSCLSFYRPNGA